MNVGVDANFMIFYTFFLEFRVDLKDSVEFLLFDLINLSGYSEYLAFMRVTAFEGVQHSLRKG